MSFDCFQRFFSKKLWKVWVITYLFHFLEAWNQNGMLVSYCTKENSYSITLKQKDPRKLDHNEFGYFLISVLGSEQSQDHAFMQLIYLHI